MQLVKPLFTSLIIGFAQAAIPATLPSTVPIEGTMEMAFNTGVPDRDEDWIINHKFYRLTKIEMWVDEIERDGYCPTSIVCWAIACWCW